MRCMWSTMWHEKSHQRTRGTTAVFCISLRFARCALVAHPLFANRHESSIHLTSNCMQMYNVCLLQNAAQWTNLHTQRLGTTISIISARCAIRRDVASAIVRPIARIIRTHDTITAALARWCNASFGRFACRRPTYAWIVAADTRPIIDAARGYMTFADPFLRALYKANVITNISRYGQRFKGEEGRGAERNATSKDNKASVVEGACRANRSPQRRHPLWCKLQLSRCAH